VNSKLTEDFVPLFAALPDAVKAQARECYRLWRQNPNHPSLHFKQIHAKESLYSVRVSKDWRALGLLQENTIFWFWIGSHADYDKLIRRI
jgi:hypothetical protein